MKEVVYAFTLSKVDYGRATYPIVHAVASNLVSDLFEFGDYSLVDVCPEDLHLEIELNNDGDHLVKVMGYFTNRSIIDDLRES